MSPSPENPEHERQLLAAAKRGDEGAFERLVLPYHGELQAHAYRMVGSLQDAEDATQEALLRAWRGIGRFEGRSSLRAWLHTITTNSSLRLIERRPKRVLPIDFGPPADPHEPTGKPLVESVWIEPYPDERLADQGTETSPEARYQQRESVELAFTAAMQHLPALQRAALIMTDVLGFSPGEVAESLEATPASIYSALQRARKATEERLPEPSQQELLQKAGDDCVKQAVDRFMAAWESADVDEISSLLTADCDFVMPPWAEWFQGRDAVLDFLPRGPLQPGRPWKAVPTQASGQPAFGAYWTDDGGALHGEGIIVLSFSEDGEISQITCFRDPDLLPRFGLPLAMDPEGSSDL
ncbi:MAG: RNA polymerase subunit sigma-70 [Solirubrobacterales bacterium]